MICLDSFQNLGYAHIEPDHYLTNSINTDSLKELETLIQIHATPDGPRNRAYLNLIGIDKQGK